MSMVTSGAVTHLSPAVLGIPVGGDSAPKRWRLDRTRGDTMREGWSV